MNFEFWRARCESGATEDSTRARKNLFEANAATAKADLRGAHENYEKSFRAWAKLFDQWPILMDDADTADVIEAVSKYIQVRDQLDLRDTSGGILPRDFPLTKLVEKKGETQLLRFLKEEPKLETKPAETTPEDKKTEEAKPAQPADAAAPQPE